MHYKRVRYTGRIDLVTSEERFWTYVEKTETCWVWTGDRRLNGYGRANLHGRSYAAHRVAWGIANGPIPEGMPMLHKCDNPPCVRPSHLFLGTHKDNSVDKYAKGRSNTTHSGRGKKLTWREVDLIRTALGTGSSRFTLANKYGVSAAMVWRIGRNLSWDPAKRRPEDP